MLGSRKVGCKVTVSDKYNKKLQEIVFYMNKKNSRKTHFHKVERKNMFDFVGHFHLHREHLYNFDHYWSQCMIESMFGTLFHNLVYNYRVVPKLSMHNLQIMFQHKNRDLLNVYDYYFVVLQS
jgi:predicted RNA-binding protein associated with RNAse of E/G family